MGNGTDHGSFEASLPADINAYLTTLEDTAQQLSNRLASDEALIGEAGEIFEAVDTVGAKLARRLASSRDETAGAVDRDERPYRHFTTAGGASVRIGSSAILLHYASGETHTHYLHAIGQIITTTATHNDQADVALCVTNQDGSMTRPRLCFYHAENARALAAALEAAVQNHNGRSAPSQE